MIRILPAVYVASAFLCGIVLLLVIIVSIVPRTRKFSGICVYAFAGLVVALTISAYALLHYCQMLHSRVASVHLGESEAEVVAALGEPTARYEPAFEFGGDKPVPNSAKLNYEVRVFPFFVDYEFEFEHDKLDGMGGQSYDY